MNTSKIVPRSRYLPLFSAFLLVASCGSSSDGDTLGGIDEKLSYDPATFSYVDPHTADFHPLGEDQFLAVRREEMLMLMATAPGEAGVAALYRDDAVVGGTVDPCGSEWLADGFSPTAASAGDVDGDGYPEPVFVGIEEGTARRRGTLHIGQPDPIGGSAGINHVVCMQLGDDFWPGSLSDVGLEVADVDGDGVDEMIVIEEWAEFSATRLRILRFTNTILGPIIKEMESSIFASDGACVTTGQFDDDPAAEILVTTRNEAGDHFSVVRLFDDYGHDLAPLGTIWMGVDLKNTMAPVVGQFDNDSWDEILLEDKSWTVGELRAARLVYYDWNGLTAVPMGEFTYTDYEPWFCRKSGGLVVADRDQDGIQEALWLSNSKCIPGATGIEQPYDGLLATLDGGVCFYTPCGAMVELRSWEPSTGEQSITDLGVEQFYPRDPSSGDLVVLDDCGAGLDVVLATYKIGPTDQVQMRSIDHTGNVIALDTLTVCADARPLMVAGDFDDDGLRLRWTGQKRLELPTPIPLAVVAAPPTKNGILQNYDKSKSTYSVPTASLDSLVVTTGTSLSTAVNRGLEEVFGIVDPPDCGPLVEACEASLGAYVAPLVSHGFAGPYDKDAIVFVGVLQHVYEYEILSAPDPDAVGELLSINVPVAAKVFKWSLDHFNATMPLEYQIPPWVLGHELGEPASYPREHDLLGLLQTHGGPFVGWAGEDMQVVMGTGKHAVSLQMADVLPWGDTYSYTVETSDLLKAGGLNTGLTAGLFETGVLTVTTARETSFTGVVGDIHVKDWQDWFYDVGLVVYTRDEQGKLPYQVLQYWTDPLGSDY